MIRVRVGIAPRTQPFDESIDSLNLAIRTAQAEGFEVALEKIRGGCPGFQNYGPVMAHLLEHGLEQPAAPAPTEVAAEVVPGVAEVPVEPAAETPAEPAPPALAAEPVAAS